MITNQPNPFYLHISFREKLQQFECFRRFTFYRSIFCILASRQGEE